MTFICKKSILSIFLIFWLQQTYSLVRKVPLRAFINTSELDNTTAAIIQEMLRLAEFWFNMEEKNTIDVALGVRYLPAMHSTTLLWHLADFVCDELKIGFMIMLAGSSPVSFGLYSSLAKRVKIPLIDWETSDLSSDSSSAFTASVRPPADELLVDYIKIKQWHEIIYLHDGANAERSLTSIYKYLEKNNPIYNLQINSYRIPEDEEYFREFLNNFHMQNFNFLDSRSLNVVVDISNSYRIRAFLQSLKESILVKKQYNYVFANFELDENDLDAFHYTLINITAFLMCDRYNQRLNKERKMFVHHYGNRSVMDDVSIPMSALFAHDALLVASNAIDIVLKKYGRDLFANAFSQNQLYNAGQPGIQCRRDLQHATSHLMPFEFGDKIIEAIREVKLNETDGTLTGQIQFTKSLSRTNFSAKVVEINPSGRSLYSVRNMYDWRQGVGFMMNAESKPNLLREEAITRLHHRPNRLHIVTVLVKPFVMLKRTVPGEPAHVGNDRFEGYCIDLIKLLAMNISGFDSYEIFIAEGNKYGQRQDDGSWDGMIGYLLNEASDVAVAPLTINQARERVVDFSKPFMTTGISIMIKKPEKQEFNVFSFMQPLGTNIWFLILCSYAGVSLTIFLVSSFSPYETRTEAELPTQLSLYNSLWFTLSSFMQQGTDILPRAPSGRIASSAWWFFTLIIVSSYTANLAAFLTLEKMTPPIESVDDLAAQKRILYGIVKGGSTEEFFKESAVPIYKKMWSFMYDTYTQQLRAQQHPNTSDTVMANTYAEGIDKVRRSKGQYAFLLEETANEYENTRKPCDTMKVGANLNSLGYGVATKIGNSLRESINFAILYLHEKGELKRLENKWWYDRGQCDQGMSMSPEGGNSASLTLSKVAGIFYILCGGMVLSMATAFAEFLYRCKLERYEATRKNHLQRKALRSGSDHSQKRSRSAEL
uniref:Glutamate receptor n=2 Tax=Wuchereria bancrofti TaxID=6293 RepID=A0AAF5PPT2_WUCBA